MTRLTRTLHILFAHLCALASWAQIDTDQVMRIGQNNMFLEDYVLSIQYFNQVIQAKPYLARPYFLRAIAKLNLDDYMGAEKDASMAIERNPFIVDAWEVRGVARQNMGRNREAIADYNHALGLLPDNRSLLYNKAMAQQEIDSLQGAAETYGVLLRRFPSFDGGYIGRARLRLALKDTVGAVADIDKALEINRNSVNAYVMRADVAINSQRDYATALADMDRAIKLQPRYPGFFINRAYLKYMTDDFQGAFADYDYALQLDPANTTALFNRAMLRSEVHDNDRAIADYTQVLALDPDEYRAMYNRAMLLADTGDYAGALADMNRVIDDFPDFAAAYFLRYDILRRKGDLQAAKRDYDRSMALAKTKVYLPGENPFGHGAVTGQGDTTQTDGGEGGDGGDGAAAGDTPAPLTQEQVKKRFSTLLTVSDNSEPEQLFNNKDIKGRVQDRKYAIELEPVFNITYYTSPTELKTGGDYIREVDEINSKRILRFLLQVTNHEPQLSDPETISQHFNSIAYYDSYLSTHTPRTIDYLGRAMDYMTLRDYGAAVADLTRAIGQSPDFAPAYLLRANARLKLAEIEQAQASAAPGTGGNPATTTTHQGTYASPGTPAGPSAPAIPQASLQRQAMFKAVLDDLDSLIKLSPAMAVAHYNKGVVLATAGDLTGALASLGRAIELKEDFGEAYYNRGYVYLSLGNREAAFTDLSRAGSLGIVPSYNLLKRMSAR